MAARSAAAVSAAENTAADAQPGERPQRGRSSTAAQPPHPQRHTTPPFTATATTFARRVTIVCNYSVISTVIDEQITL